MPQVPNRPRATRRRARSRRGGPGWLMLAGLLAMLLSGCAGTQPPATGLAAETAAAGQASEAATAAEATLGISVEGLRLSAAGSMLDLRYRVLDPRKAAPLLDGKIQPKLLDAAHDAQLGVPDTPVLGRIRQTSRNNKILTDRTYFVMFGNPGKAVKSGDKVSLLLGSVRISDLTVQ